MTAVAHPPNFQTMKGWAGPNGAANGLGGSMNTDDMSRLLLQPRKVAQRTNSSSSLNSLSSSASSNSTISASSAQSNAANGANGAANGDWSSRKRTARSLWPATKSEPIAGLSNARPQTMASASSGPSATSAISALHTPSNMQQPNGQTQTQQNGLSRPQQQQSENLAVLYLTPMNGTFERKTITVPYYPDVLRIGRQTNKITLPTPQNGYFDSKVLSRSHAEVWADRNGKIWIRDVKSSNGTFVNGQRLSQENKDSDPHELREQDMLELGIDIVSEDQKTVVHHKVAARVEHAGFYGGNSVLDLNFGDLDPNGSANLMGSALGQGMGQMRRTASQSSIGSNSRMSVGSASQPNLANMQQRQQHFWLTPVNMDKIIQKLNSEYKAAKQQSLDLQRTSQYIDSVLTSEQTPPKKDGQKASPIEKTKGLKTRFSDPPAPPPQAPLPEKPDAALQRTGSGLGLFQPSSLSRSDTEKPKLGNTYSPVKTTETLASAVQIANLVESLSKTKQEVEVQSARLREVEDMLVQERVRREDAEERAKRLEKERNLPDAQRSISTQQEEPATSIEEQSEAKNDEVSTKKLQERLDQLLVEFREVKATAERWKLDKEQAEKERDEEREERKTLAEMVEQFRAQETERVEKEKKREVKRGRRRSRSASAGSSKPRGITDGTDEAETNAMQSDVPKGAQQNGHPLVQQNHPQGSDTSDTNAVVQRDPHYAQAAPYVSAVSVVFLGVAIMALINNWQRGETSLKG